MTHSNRHTADVVTLAVTEAMATPVAPEATAADSQATSALAMARRLNQLSPSAQADLICVPAAVASAFAESTLTDSNTADATNPPATGAEPTATGASSCGLGTSSWGVGHMLNTQLPSS